MKVQDFYAQMNRSPRSESHVASSESLPKSLLDPLQRLTEVDSQALKDRGAMAAYWYFWDDGCQIEVRPGGLTQSLFPNSLRQESSRAARPGRPRPFPPAQRCRISKDHPYSCDSAP